MSSYHHSKLRCPYQNNIYGICTNSKCRRSAILCQKGYTDGNECSIFHDKCTKVQWAEVIKLIDKNPHLSSPEFDKVIDRMDTCFEKMLETIKEEHQKFRLWVKTYGYSIEVMKFIKDITDQQYANFTGQYLSPIVGQILSAKKMSHTPLVAQTDITNLQTQILNKISNISDIYLNADSVETDVIPSVSTSHLPGLDPNDTTFITDQEVVTPVVVKPHHKSHRQNIARPSSDIFTTPVNPLNSKITSDAESIKSLFDKAVDQVHLLFRASEKKFDITEFHKACDDIPNTLVLIETQFGKVIGGFTPIAWKSSKKHWAPDKQQQSFVFSLNMRQKFKLNLAQFAIANNPEKGPIFGCCDICINDKANKQRCNAEFPISYNNGRYVRSPDTCFAFTGHPKGKYLVKEWEVFKIVFK